MSKSITRRDAIAGAGAAAGATLVAFPAVAELVENAPQVADAELHRLWDKYVEAMSR